MAEDLALHQIIGDGGAVDGDEGLVPPRARAVDGLGAELLAGAALAGNEDGGLRGGRAVDQPIDHLHPGRSADETVIAVAAAILPVGVDQARQPLALESVAQRHQKALGCERLDEEVVSAAAHRLDREVDRAVSGDDDHGDPGGLAAEPPQQVEPVHVGQVDVEKDQIEIRPGRAGRGPLLRFRPAPPPHVRAASARHRAGQGRARPRRRGRGVDQRAWSRLRSEAGSPGKDRRLPWPAR